MPKRKRDGEQLQDDADHEVQESVKRSRHVRIEQILELGKNNVSKSLKLARGFERQKLGRRAKLARENNAVEEMARLEAEVIALKARCILRFTLDMTAIAEIHMYKSILKYKPIFSSLALPYYITTKVHSYSQPQDTAHANVQARLFNSNPVKTAVDEVIENIRSMLGIGGAQPARRKRLRAADFASANTDRTIEPPRSDEMRQTEDDGLEGSPAPGYDDAEDWSSVWEGLSDDKAESASDSDNDIYAAYASRLAQSDDETTSQDSMAAPAGHVSITSYRVLNGHPPSPSPSRSASPEISSSKTNITKTSSSTPKSTTFLPSLMMGGYWSGSESGEDDDASQLETRKNRRGQQARRALWEKKFGRNANHLKKQAQDRNQGWDPRKGASDGNGLRGKRGRGRDGSSMRSNDRQGSERVVRSGANSDPIKMRERKSKPVEGPLHPSWVAAKKAKEAKVAVAFQGKKVVFD